MNMSAERMLQPPSSPMSNREKAFPVISQEEKSPQDPTPLLDDDEDGVLAEKWFVEREKMPENQKVPEAEEPLENVEAFINETINKAGAEAARAEKASATKTGKALHGLHKVFEATGGTLVALYEHLKEDAEDFAHDTSDTFLGTTATDTMKGFWKNMFGKQNAKIRTQPHEQHRGIREMAIMEVTTLKEVWGALAEIPEDIARRLDAWSPETLQARSEQSREMEEKAWEERNGVLRTMEAEERNARAGNLVQEELNATLQNIQDRRDNADAHYAAVLQDVHALAPTLAGAAIKGSVWWATRGIPRTVWITAPQALNHIAMDGLVTEMAQNFVRGVRQERRTLHEEKKPHVPYSRDMQSMWGPLERSMGSMERLGEMLGGIGARMREAREEHQGAVVDEAKNAQRAEGGIYQDAITKRIEALTEKTKISQEDKGEIAYLAAKLVRARQGEIGADEMATLVTRAEAFAKKAEAHQDDDEHLLLGYITGRAINTIRSLTIMQGKEGESMIRALQEDPNVKNLRRAEALVHAHVERELRPASEKLLTAEHRAKLQRARETLQDSVSRATELYTSNLAHATADLTKGLQAVSREMKRTLAQAEAAHQEQAAAK